MAFENVFQGRLVLFNNSKKESQNQPDLTGNIEFTQEDAMAMAEWITGQPGEENYKGENSFIAKKSRCLQNDRRKRGNSLHW